MVSLETPVTSAVTTISQDGAVHKNGFCGFPFSLLGTGNSPPPFGVIVFCKFVDSSFALRLEGL